MDDPRLSSNPLRVRPARSPARPVPAGRTQPPERLKMTGGAVAQGIRYTAAGEHETEGKAALRAHQEDVEQIIQGWPAPQRTVARQLLDKYGPPNEATPTRLFWYRNGPWKRTELTSDVVVHH